MDIKGGCSTANADWPYFQILDQVVPLMRKEKIEKIPHSSLDHRDLDAPQDSLPSPLTTPIVPEQDPLSEASDPLSVTSVNTVMVSAQSSTVGDGKCKIEAVDGEPPRKRGRGRRAAQRARDRWWGAVEDDDMGSDSTGIAVRGELTTQQGTPKSSTVDNLDPSQMEVQTFHMLESCSSALAEIRETLRLHTERQETLMQSLQQTVMSQGNTVKELLSTMTTQNATLIALMTQINTRSSQSSLDMTSTNGSFDDQKHTTEQRGHNHRAGQLLTSQQNLISALSHETQDCENQLVETSELTDDMTGL
ncbi:uncharacterized protein LOC121874867 isoform X4 [Homarus americanus]|uniref:Uncharacterized protein n=2 Tax=Homarus americanus TaxID=6706 RepID=A0A8J5JY76_HOMAM|nr:uncharacterized protein LOC121874867 isoform X4 [Homarus americanus]XP_042235100.1 uncharacterized protein LOC121874867 isoform X4 [Homarus americanus]KAG7161574.1 hypothetical protein Hamer_G014135 [Homarus americanus]